jgi:NCS1 family nucleobase:cation symporter-1
MGLPGMVGVFAPKLVSLAAKNMYRLGWILTFTTAAVVYATLVTFFPVQVYPEPYKGEPRTFEYMAKNGGYFPGEEPESVIHAAALPDIEKDLEEDEKRSTDKVHVTPA